MYSQLSEEQKNEIQFIVDFFFKGKLKLSNIDGRVAEVVYKMVEQAQLCSDSMDLIPRPAGFKPGISYILQQLAKIALRLRTNNAFYLSCRDAVALNWKTPLRLAEMGL